MKLKAHRDRQFRYRHVQFSTQDFSAHLHDAQSGELQLLPGIRLKVTLPAMRMELVQLVSLRINRMGRRSSCCFLRISYLE